MTEAEITELKIAVAEVRIAAGIARGLVWGLLLVIGSGSWLGLVGLWVMLEHRHLHCHL
ncbi:hypothetical protein AGMMS49990_01770 [Endomicrobiia bacterium]|nr:hypothetical protein AGMMS49990_01770 [Endomicrobiia bacterium]